MLIKPTNLDINSTACLYVVHILQHPTSHPTTRLIQDTMVNAPEMYLSPLLAGKYANSTLISSWRRGLCMKAKLALGQKVSECWESCAAYDPNRILLRRHDESYRSAYVSITNTTFIRLCTAIYLNSISSSFPKLDGILYVRAHHSASSVQDRYSGSLFKGNNPVVMSRCTSYLEPCIPAEYKCTWEMWVKLCLLKNWMRLRKASTILWCANWEAVGLHKLI